MNFVKKSQMYKVDMFIVLVALATATFVRGEIWCHILFTLVQHKKATCETWYFTSLHELPVFDCWSLAYFPARDTSETSPVYHNSNATDTPKMDPVNVRIYSNGIILNIFSEVFLLSKI